jgi:hypothetical protein
MKVGSLLSRAMLLIFSETCAYSPRAALHKVGLTTCIVWGSHPAQSEEVGAAEGRWLHDIYYSHFKSADISDPAPIKTLTKWEEEVADYWFRTCISA